MPVKFETKSEYQRKYENGRGDVVDPPLPEFYKRPASQAKHSSSESGVTCEPAIQNRKKPSSSSTDIPKTYEALEPPIQRKKKPISPHGSRPIDFSQNGQEVWKSGDEYVLLGNQDKFTSNVVYKAKPVVATKVDAEPTQVVQTPQAPRPDPAPKVAIDTGAPKHVNKHKTHVITNGHPQQTNGHQHAVPVPSEPQHPVPVPVKSTGEPRGRPRHKQPRPSPPKTHHNAAPKDPVNKPYDQKAINKTATRKAARKGQVDEIVQADLEKGVVDSEQQAPANYALQYKAGIAPPRAKGPKRLSEYQMQFAWKRPVGASPLLDAEQVVYKSSTQLVPKKAEFSKTTEYKKQFQPWKSTSGLDLPVQHVQESVKASPAKKSKVPRSKSVDALRADRREPAGVRRSTSDHDPRLVQQSLNPSRLHFPHGPYKNIGSEYAMNYAAPQEFAYEEGAWKGAAPPQLQQVSKPEGPTASASSSTTWYAEVMELRNKAQEYKKRAHGTHFSRQHVAQLFAQQTELWDTASVSSVVSALSLEHPGIERPQKVVQKKSSKTTISEQPPAGKRTAWGQDRDPPSQGEAVDESDTETLKSASIAPSFWSARSSVSGATPIADYHEQPLVSPPGRIPTPKMSDQGLRHHLDRTTPLIGGALLSSPPSQQMASKGRKQSQDSVVSSSVVSSPPPEQSVARTKQAQTSKSVESLTHPTYGMPTRDNHPLLDDDASTDRPMVTQFVHDSHSAHKGAKHNRDKFPGVQVPSTIQEAGAATYNARNRVSHTEVTLDDITPRGEIEDDILSMSARSVASSCSLASEVLDRARQRRDGFWARK